MADLYPPRKKFRKKGAHSGIVDLEDHHYKGLDIVRNNGGNIEIVNIKPVSSFPANNLPETLQMNPDFPTQISNAPTNLQFDGHDSATLNVQDLITTAADQPDDFHGSNCNTATGLYTFILVFHMNK